MDTDTTYTAFQGDDRLTRGTLADVAVAVKHATGDAPVLIFNDATGGQMDVDTRGDDDQVRARHSPAPPSSRGRGRPKLGVISREVTLLPRHWDWLGEQPGGASVALRKLVERARRDGDNDAHRRDAVYRFMAVMAGDRPGFEEASRALYAGDRAEFNEQTAAWPSDIRNQISALLTGD